MPKTPKYAPPTVIEKIIRILLISSASFRIFGFITFASICCNTISTIATQTACINPPVNIVIKHATITAIIAPKYGIKLNNPIKKPSNNAYLTFIIDNAIDIIIATTIASRTWPDMYLKNISFPFSKYLFIVSHLLLLKIQPFNLFINFIISALSNNIY